MTCICMKPRRPVWPAMYSSLLWVGMVIPRAATHQMQQCSGAPEPLCDFPCTSKGSYQDSFEGGRTW